MDVSECDPTDAADLTAEERKRLVSLGAMRTAQLGGEA
jgi:hypothetical protein